jgi:predicted DNA-binding transcriptional regulator AlpA
MPACLPQLVKADVISESTGLSVKHVFRLAQQCQIPHYRILGSVRFKPQDFADWLDSHKIAA